MLRSARKGASPSTHDLDVPSDHPFFLQCRDIAGTHAEPIAKDLRRVLSEQRSRLELWRLAIKAHRPGRHLERPSGMFGDLQDAALGEARLVHQLHRVEHRPRRYPGRADQAHRLVLVAPLGPIGDYRIELFDALAAGSCRLVSRVADQLLAAEKLEQAV